MKQWKLFTIVGFFFVLICGTLLHFVYEWTNQCYVTGLFAPVNESVWEHMKLVFFPMLFYSVIAIWRIKERHSCVISGLCFGILVGTWCIPALYYAYTFILGRNVFFLDLTIFVISAGIAFYLTGKLTLSCRLQPYTVLLCCLVCVLFVCFLVFSYHPPALSIFAEP